jgi:integrase
MNADQNYRGDRVEIAVKGHPGVFRVWHWNKAKERYVDPESIPGSRARRFRAVRRVKTLGVWKKVQKNFDTLEEARAWRSSLDIPGPQARESTYSVRNLLEDWREWTKPPRVAESTWEIYGKVIEHMTLLLGIPVESLQAEDIDEWLRRLIEPSYPKSESRFTFKREVETLNTILNWYRERKNPRYQPPILRRHKKDALFRKVPPKHNPFLTVNQLEAVLERLAGFQKPVYSVLASFQALTGTRIGEACGLMWDDVDLDNFRSTKYPTAFIHQIIWWEHKTRKPHLREGTKTDDPRHVALCPRLIALLKDWKQKSLKGPYVFHNDSGGPLRYPAIQNAFNKAFEALKLPQRSTHVFRHTFATLFANETGNRLATQSFLGHKSSKMTDHYAKAQLQSQFDAMENFKIGQIKADKSSPPEGGQVIPFQPKRIELSPNVPQEGIGSSSSK